MLKAVVILLVVDAGVTFVWVCMANYKINQIVRRVNRLDPYSKED